MSTDTEERREKYALTHYGYKAWQLEKYGEITNPRTKESRWDWQTVKYPGNLEAAARGLLDSTIGEQDKKDAQELIAIIQKAEANIIQTLKDLISERSQ